MADLFLREGWLWLLGSLLLAVLWANVAWLFRSPRPGVLSGFVARLRRWRLACWLLQALRMAYYIAVPAVALLWRRALGERPMGLVGVETFASVSDKWTGWARDLGWAVALGVCAWAVLALGWRTYRNALSVIGKREDGRWAAAISGWPALREAAYHEVHWAFYRSLPVAVTLERTGDAYWGVWIGLALVLLEAALNPDWRRGLADPSRAPGLLMRAALAVVSGVLFLETENLWLAIALHWGVSWGLAALSSVAEGVGSRTTV